MATNLELADEKLRSTEHEEEFIFSNMW
jgi:hypothetical protein